MQFELLTQHNLDQYLSYLKKAHAAEPELMTAEAVDAAGIRHRLTDPFYQNTRSILAISDGLVVGRLEYHFYGCLQDGYRMAYVDWVYVLPEYRRSGIAAGLFREFEEACRKNNIHQYFLIRSDSPEAQHFYSRFEQAELTQEPLLRKYIGE